MSRSDIPHEVNEQIRENVSKLLAAMLLLEYGDTGTHHSRDVRDKQVKILLKQIYVSFTGAWLFHTDIPRVELWHEKTSIFDNPTGESDNG